MNKADVTEQFVRSGGKGGQNVNKVATCVILKHIPTGIVVRCSEERTQGKNRVLAWERLERKLADLEAETIQKEVYAKEAERRRNRKRPRALKESILKSKRRRSETKQNRRKVYE